VFVVDTNLLIHATNEDSPAHSKMRRLLGEWGSAHEPWYATWPIAYEFMRVVTHPSVFARPLTFADAWRFIESLGLSSSFGFLVETQRHAQVLQDLTREYPHAAGSILHDLHTAAVMREHGVAEIRTADIDFHQFKFLRVVNPL
jgi:uncharacterized protein